MAWATQVARELLAEALPQRWAHVQGVASRARVATVTDDQELLVAAAILHDIGYAPSISATGFHPLDGAYHLTRIGAPRRLVNLVAHHSCARLEAEIRGLTGAIAEFEDEGPSAMRDALWWADMTTTPGGGVTNIADRIAEIQDRYGDGDIVSSFIRQARPELEAAVARTETRLQAAAGASHEK